ncbi:MAG: MAPEG family protein [Pseudomonadota bacterium]
MQSQMLAPAAVLIAWTLIVLLWIIPSRFGAIAKADKSKLPNKAGVRGQDLEGVLPDKANWPAHNHTHLHEQPTLFYAVSVILAVIGPATLDITLAWTYVGVRMAHSLWQILVNTVPVRFLLFFSGCLVLIALAIRALLATVFV